MDRELEVEKLEHYIFMNKMLNLPFELIGICIEKFKRWCHIR